MEYVKQLEILNRCNSVIYKRWDKIRDEEREKGVGKREKKSDREGGRKEIEKKRRDDDKGGGYLGYRAFLCFHSIIRRSKCVRKFTSHTGSLDGGDWDEFKRLGSFPLENTTNRNFWVTDTYKNTRARARARNPSAQKFWTFPLSPFYLTNIYLHSSILFNKYFFPSSLYQKITNKKEKIREWIIKFRK